MPPPTTFAAPERRPISQTPIAERDQRLAKLDAEVELKMLAIKEKANTAKADCVYRRQKREVWEGIDAQVSFRTRNTNPLFRWAHGMWECSKLMASDEAELARLNAAVRWHDSAVDAWVKADEKQILKEWSRRKEQLMNLSVY